MKILVEKRQKLLMVGICLALFILYFPVISNDYAFSDDWVRINQILTNKLQWGQLEIQTGRPLYGLLLSLSNFFIRDSSDLAYFRFIYVIGLIIFCYLFYKFLTARKIFGSQYYLNLLIPLTICTSSPLYLHGAWFVCFPYVLSLIFSLISYEMASSDECSLPRVVFSILFLISSFAIYQTSAMIFLLFLALDELGVKNKGDKTSLRKIVICFLILGISMLAALAMVKLLPSLVGLTETKRSNLDFNFFKSIYWFIVDGLPFFLRSLFMKNISSSMVFIVYSLLLILLAICVKRIKIYFLLIFLFVFSFFPQLANSEKWLAIRSSLLPLSFLIIFIYYIISKMPNKICSILISCFFCISICFHTEFVFNENFIKVTKQDFEELSAMVKNKKKNCITVDLYDRKYAIGNFQISDEIGIRSSAIEWAIPGMLRELGKEPSNSKDSMNCVVILQKEIR